MCGRNAQFAAVLLSGTLLVNPLLQGGQAQEIALDGEIVAPDDRAAHIDEDGIAGNRPARARIATRLAGPGDPGHDENDRFPLSPRIRTLRGTDRRSSQVAFSVSLLSAIPRNSRPRASEP
jgi:hypothetical protein